LILREIKALGSFKAKAMPAALRSTEWPAEAATKLLTRLGLGILFIGLPCAGIVWRGAIYVLLPVGAILILIGALVDAPRLAGRRFAGSLASPPGAAALFVAFWAGLSLIWTPFPAQAGERFLQISAAALLAALAAAYLPQRTKSIDLYLLPAGLALASAATLILTYLGPPWFFSRFEYDESLFERSMITAIILVWPALGCLSLREHWTGASVLAVLVAAVALAGFAQILLLAMGAGALAFVLAMSGPQRTARFLGWLLAALTLLSPLFPLLYKLALGLFGAQAGAGSVPMLDWAGLIQSQWLRLITGHGFDFVHAGLSFGYLPAATPRSLLFVLWHDLGVVGAAGFAVLTLLVFEAAGRTPVGAAPALLGGLAAALTIAIIGLAASQIWWLTLLACDAIAFGVLVKGLDGAWRPDVRAILTAGARAPQPPLEGNAADSGDPLHPLKLPE
jgi:hypothetical protein